MPAYHYKECGLDNVMVEGIPCQDDDGDEVVTIHNIAGLHHTIAEAIVAHKAGISGKELRFLRTEMGMTQAELAKVVHHDTQSIGRWERGEIPIEPNADAIIRLLAVERLNLSNGTDSVEGLSGRCVPTAAPQQILIDGHDPTHYRALELAA
ncbi:MAG TPA: helix-turn-helix transcriptional regulator [Pseudolabrys sp.]|uniref:helix-turn-helix domain-containing protein n=1 Tax=Pseudolabrys sp. TaxID=1960880 RepID=UPI002DDD1737|nr:helix-turn-helix transcriptional regulator [Pseudolabrys sp.]HEV2629526.1 helix-turn-helix transcriptional regulator [Pseudolabrys sp.]